MFVTTVNREFQLLTPPHEYQRNVVETNSSTVTRINLAYIKHEGLGVKRCQLFQRSILDFLLLSGIHFYSDYNHLYILDLNSFLKYMLRKILFIDLSKVCKETLFFSLSAEKLYLNTHDG